jgi:Cyclic nucleotide-binding domain
VRIERSVTSVSWIPSEAMSGPMRIPMDIGLGHYDPPPPDAVDDSVLKKLEEDDAMRFANQLKAWIDVKDGTVVGAGYNGGSIVGSTTVKLGSKSVKIPAVAFPDIQAGPVMGVDSATFTQTAGGRTGSPLPRRIDRAPFIRLTAPTAWTTLSLTIGIDGSASFEVVGASPFPRHWIYGTDGQLVSKSGVIDFAEWTRFYDHDRTPWSDQERHTLMSDVESGIERQLSTQIMGADKQTIRHLATGETLTIQGQAATEVYLILDGVLEVDVDDEIVAEVGPGSIVGERAVLEDGTRTSTLRAVTPVRVAAIVSESLSGEDLAQVATKHRRES